MTSHWASFIIWFCRISGTPDSTNGRLKAAFVITGIDFGDSELPEIEHLIAVLAEAGAAEVALRQINNAQITAYHLEEQESVA